MIVISILQLLLEIRSGRLKINEPQNFLMEMLYQILQITLFGKAYQQKVGVTGGIIVVTIVFMVSYIIGILLLIVEIYALLTGGFH